MDISSIGNVASVYQNASRMMNNKVSSTNFVNFMQNATAIEKTELYKKSLENKFGCPITVASIGKDQKSMDRFAGGTVGSGNVAIAPNILEQMATNPEKAAYYEKKIQEHFDSIPATEMFLASHNLRMTTSGVTINEDGTVTYYCSAEETPEYKAKVAADHKAKREKEAKEREENIEHSQKVAEESHRIETEIFRKRNIESYLRDQVFNVGEFTYAVSPESLISILKTKLSDF